MDTYTHLKSVKRKDTKLDKLAEYTWDFLTDDCKTSLEKNLARAFYELVLNKGARPF